MEETAQQELIANLLKYRPHLTDLETLVNKIKYGKINLVLTVENSKISSMEVVSRQLIRYDKGENLTNQ